MAKSTRSKVKRSYRAKKREDGVFAATEAARLQRLNAKLAAVRDTDASTFLAPLNPDEVLDDDDATETAAGEAGADSMAIDPTDPSVSAVEPSTTEPTTTSDSATKAEKVSTHGPRMSRRAEWRVSKGMASHPKSRGMNRQGGIAAKSRSGRAHRRR